MRRRCSCSPWLCLLIALLAAATFSGAAQAQVVGSVSVDFNVTAPNVTSVFVTNTSSSPFTVLTVLLTGIGPIGACPGDTRPSALGGALVGPFSAGMAFNTVAPGQTLILTLPSFDVRGQAAFQVLAVQNGILVGATFSPYANATGGFLPLVGNDILGCLLPGATVPVTKVADLATVPCTPALTLQLLNEASPFFTGAFSLQETLELDDVLSAAAGSTGKTRAAWLRCALCLLRDVAARNLNAARTRIFTTQLEAVIRCLLAGGG